MMLYMKKSVWYLGAVAAGMLMVQCNNVDNEELVKFEAVKSAEPLAELVKSVEVVPLETDSVHFVGQNPDLLVCGDGYIVADMQNSRIYHYSADGRFLNSIGSKGNGPREYVAVKDVQCSGNEVTVYAMPDKALVYSVDGNYISTVQAGAPGAQTYAAEGGWLTYYGYGMVSDKRLEYKSLSGEVTGYLPADAKVISLSSPFPVFSDAADGGVLLADSFNPSILKFKNLEVSEYVTFDLGDLAVPESYYEYDDAFKAAESLFGSKFAFPRRFFENEEWQFVEIFVQDKMKAVPFYGICGRKGWIWFGPGSEDSPLLFSFRGFDNDGNLLCIVDPSLLSGLPGSIRGKVTDPDVLANAGPEDNYLIFKLRL